jgi:hypothetical protein
MRTRLAALVVAACMPGAVFAQRRAAAPASDEPAPAASPRSMPKTPTARELAETNPAALLIGKRKKLSLADAAVAELKAVEKKINDRNAAFMVQYDSVHKWTVPLASSSASVSQPGFSDADRTRAMSTTSPAEQAKMESSLRDVRALLADFRTRRGADDADALAAIPDAQKKAATDLLKKQDTDLDKMIGTAGGRP